MKTNIVVVVSYSAVCKHIIIIIDGSLFLYSIQDIDGYCVLISVTFINT